MMKLRGPHASGGSSFRRYGISPEMLEGLLDACFGDMAASLNLAHQHRSLYSGDAEIGEPIFVRLLGEALPRFLPDKKCCKFALHHFEDQAQILPDQLIALLDLITDRSERTAALHVVGLLLFDLTEEP